MFAEIGKIFHENWTFEKYYDCIVEWKKPIQEFPVSLSYLVMSDILNIKNKYTWNFLPQILLSLSMIKSDEIGKVEPSIKCNIFQKSYFKITARGVDSLQIQEPLPWETVHLMFFYLKIILQEMLISFGNEHLKILHKPKGVLNASFSYDIEIEYFWRNIWK